jgi:nondiscriminating aspartyl-tRNA synthetase
MERTLTGELRSHIGERVRLAGWLHHQRRLVRMTFVLLRDRAGLAQVVVEEPEAIEVVAALLPETVLEAEATVAVSEQAPGGIELRDPTFTVVAEPAEAPPVELRRPELKESLPVQLDYAPVALRHPRRREAFEIAAASVRGFRAALDALGFVEIQTPKLVASATEGGSNVFRVDYFGRDAYLAQSPQFFKQTMVGVFERVYEVGPVFRAEPHETSRHLAEYVSLDAELGFVRDHFDVMRVLREAVAGMCESVRAAGFEAPEVPVEIPWVHFADTGVDDVDLGSARSAASSSCS